MDLESKYKRLEDTLFDLRSEFQKMLVQMKGIGEELARRDKQNVELIDRNIDAHTRIDELETSQKELELKIKASEKLNKTQKEEIKYLQDKLHRKNSRNSSIPPSQDENRPRKDRSLRKKSGKKPGGQKGHKGITLEMVARPTEIVDHYPSTCSNCGDRLSGIGNLEKRRQVIDLPKFVPDVIEHRSYSLECSCGCKTLGAFPKNVKSPISYGARTEAFIGYLSVRQYIPIKRIEEIFKQVFGLKISAGTITNKLGQCSDKLLKYYTWIQNEIGKSKVVGSDETSCRVDGEKGWIWTWQNDYLTFLKYSPDRKAKIISDTFPKGLPNSILVHDCLPAQFKIDCLGHQICTAHLLRELNYFIEKGDSWSVKFKAELMRALLLLEKIKSNPKKNYRRSINYIYRSVEKLLSKVKKGKGKLQAFKYRMQQKRESLFRYLEDPSIPPDNNGSERALRNMKVKIKVSGMFKTDIGADQFAVIRSVIDTYNKRGLPIWETLVNTVS